MSRWIITFIVQTTLVASRRTRVHVWLGPFATAVAVIAGWTTMDALRREVGAHLGFDPRVWWLGSTVPPVLLFSGFAVMFAIGDLFSHLQPRSTP